MSNQEDKQNFIKKIDNDDFFIDSEVSEQEYNSSSDVEPLKNDLITVVSSKTNTVILQQLFKQQNVVLNSQRTIYKLKNEINREELKMRYLKLDLNNYQIDNEEKRNKINDLNTQLFVSKSENQMFRGLSFLYTVYIIGSYFL